MRYITADYIFPISSPPVKNGVVVVNNEEVIQDVLEPQPQTSNLNLETFKGIICPGFINAHCHLELSHLKGKLTEGKGLTQFIKEIIPNRSASQEVIQEAIVHAEDEMIANGIVGVGDICNTSHTFAQKAKGRLRYHNFIELFDIDANLADENFKNGKLLEDVLPQNNAQSSLVPHAPYTVTTRLLHLIKSDAEANDSILTIHNQETVSENDMFVSGKGELLETLKSITKVYDHWQPTGLSSLASVLMHLPSDNKILLVHNTYTTQDDLDNLKSKISNLKSIYWCFCPNANLYIENKLPDFKLFMDGACKMVVGTDSYASNWSLSVLDELKTIQKHAPNIKLETLLRWATLNGAEFFGWEKKLGSIEKGKKPGLNLIEHVDLFKMQLSAESMVKKLI